MQLNCPASRVSHSTVILISLIISFLVVGAFFHFDLIRLSIKHDNRPIINPGDPNDWIVRDGHLYQLMHHPNCDCLDVNR